MAGGGSERRPVAQVPLMLGMLRHLAVAAVIDRRLPPHPDNVLSCGPGVAALVWALLDGHAVLSKGGPRLAERGHAVPAPTRLTASLAQR